MGRADDVALLETLLTEDAALPIAVAVEGLFGIGKTELALHLAYRLSRRALFVGGIFWLDAGADDLSPQWGGRIADQMGIAEGTVAERARRVLLHIEESGPSLVIVDDSDAAGGGVISHPLPVGSQIRMLATTRTRDFGGSSFRHVTLGVVSREAAKDLLVAIAGMRRSTEENADGLLAYLDGLVLAVELAAAYLKRYPSISVSEYFFNLRSSSLVNESFNDKTRHGNTVQAAFKATVRGLDELSRRALRVCSYFANADASVELLRACGVTIEMEAELRDLHLISGDHEWWSMHGLVRECGRRGIDNEERRLVREAFWAGCSSLLDDPRLQNEAFGRDRPHYEELADRAMSTLEGIPLPGRLSILYKVGKAARAVGALDSAFRYLSRASELWKEAFESSRKLFTLSKVERIGEDGSVLETYDPLILNNVQCAYVDAELAWCMQQAGKHDAALKLFEESDQILEKHAGIKSREFFLSRTGHVMALLSVGSARQAEKMARPWVKAIETHFGRSSDVACEARVVLAAAIEKQERYDEAILLCLSVIKDIKRRTDEHNRQRVSAQARVGYCYFAKKDFANAVSYLEMAVLEGEGVFGAGSIELVQIRANLVACRIEQGETVKARTLLCSIDSAYGSVDRLHPANLHRRLLWAEILAAEADFVGAAEAALNVKAELSPLRSPGVFQLLYDEACRILSKVADAGGNR